MNDGGDTAECLFIVFSPRRLRVLGDRQNPSTGLKRPMATWHRPMARDEGAGSAGFLPALAPTTRSDLPVVGWLLRSANRRTGGRGMSGRAGHSSGPSRGAGTAGRRPRQGFSCAGMLSLIASFCGASPTAMWEGIDCGFDRQGNTPLHPWLAVRSGDLKPLASPAWRAGRHRPTKKAAPGK